MTVNALDLFDWTLLNYRSFRYWNSVTRWSCELPCTRNSKTKRDFGWLVPGILQPHLHGIWTVYRWTYLRFGLWSIYQSDAIRNSVVYQSRNSRLIWLRYGFSKFEQLWRVRLPVIIQVLHVYSWEESNYFILHTIIIMRSYRQSWWDPLRWLLPWSKEPRVLYQTLVYQRAVDRWT